MVYGVSFAEISPVRPWRCSTEAIIFPIKETDLRLTSPLSVHFAISAQTVEDTDFIRNVIQELNCWRTSGPHLATPMNIFNSLFIENSY
jgi:hypothetical protein